MAEDVLTRVSDTLDSDKSDVEEPVEVSSDESGKLPGEDVLDEHMQLTFSDFPTKATVEDYKSGTWQWAVAKILANDEPFSFIENISDEDKPRALGHIERGEFPHVYTLDERQALSGEMPAEEVAERMSTDFHYSMMNELEKQRPEILEEVFYYMADITLQDQVIDWVKGEKKFNSRAIKGMFNSYGDIRPRRIMLETVGFIGADFDARIPLLWGDAEGITSIREYAYLPVTPRDFITPAGNPSYDRLNRYLKKFYGLEFNMDRDFFNKKLKRSIMEGNTPSKLLLEEYGVPVLGERALTKDNFERERQKFFYMKKEAAEEMEGEEEEVFIAKPLSKLKTQSVPKGKEKPELLVEGMFVGDMGESVPHVKRAEDVIEEEFDEEEDEISTIPTPEEYAEKQPMMKESKKWGKIFKDMKGRNMTDPSDMSPEQLDEQFRTHPHVETGDLDALRVLYLNDEIALTSISGGHDEFRRKIGRGKTKSEKAWSRAYDIATGKIGDSPVLVPEDDVVEEVDVDMSRLMALKKPELQKMASEFGLPIDGTKKEITTRILNIVIEEEEKPKKRVKKKASVPKKPVAKIITEEEIEKKESKLKKKFSGGVDSMMDDLW
tara:strand:+ start:14031 stop:15854 length:1824 start_codon:yes stop_codon:yes gene_type:complete